MNRSREREFEWDFVEKSVRRSVLVAMVGIGLLAIGTVGVSFQLMDTSTSESVRHLYQTKAVKGRAGGQITKDIAEPQQPDQVAVEPVAELPEEPQPLSERAEHHAALDNPSAEVTPREPEQAAAVIAQTEPAAESVEAPKAADPLPMQEPVRSEPAHPSPPAHTSPSFSHGGLAEAEESANDASVGSVEIRAGVNAPHYTLTSIDEYHRMGLEGGRFLAWDGRNAILLGRSLDANLAELEFQTLDSSFHRRFSTRMVPVPANSPSVRAARQAVVDRFSRQIGGQVEVMLALPLAYDQEILRSQNAWFESRGLPLDVRAITEGRFEAAPRGGIPRFQITDVITGR